MLLSFYQMNYLLIFNYINIQNKKQWKKNQVKAEKEWLEKEKIKSKFVQN